MDTSDNQQGVQEVVIEIDVSTEENLTAEARQELNRYVFLTNLYTGDSRHVSLQISIQETVGIYHYKSLYRRQ
jgi:hypothetical protein